MQGILIKTDNTITVEDFAEPTLDSLQAAVGGYIEHVKPMGLTVPYCMIINEEGRLNGLPFNPMASCMYGVQLHGETILGDVVIMADGYNDDGEPDIVGLTDSDVVTLLGFLNYVVLPAASLFKGGWQ